MLMYNLPKIKAESYLRDVMARYRNKLVYDASTGEIRDDRKHMSMLEDFWLPRREVQKALKYLYTIGWTKSWRDIRCSILSKEIIQIIERTDIKNGIRIWFQSR